MNHSDISNRDFNPTVLYACKNKRTQSGFIHTHDHIELHFVLSGSGKYTIRDTKYNVAAGDLLLLNPGEMHAHICSAENPLFLFSVGFEDICLKGRNENEFYFPNEQPVFHTSSDLKEKLTDLCYNMLNEESAPLPGRYFMMRSYLTQMLILIIRNNAGTASSVIKCDFTSSQKSYVVKTILEYMQKHYQQKVSLDQIAGNMYISSVYISKVFKEETGNSPINHLIQIRLEKATELMSAEPSLTIKEIAKSVGYDDAYYFSRLFKKYYGVSPSQFSP